MKPKGPVIVLELFPEERARDFDPSPTPNEPGLSISAATVLGIVKRDERRAKTDEALRR